MIRFAIVGCGSMANWHAERMLKIPDIQVAALVDIKPERTAEFKTKYFHDAAEYESMEEMLKKSGKKLDAVLLVTPHSVHFPHAKAALEHGLHVMCEKPMVTSSKHAYELWRLVKKTGKLLAVTYQSAYTEEFGYLAQQRDAGKLGKVQVISGWLAQHWLHGTRGSWRQDPAIAGGGQMYDSGAHLFNAIMWLMNEPVVQVGCFYDRCDSPVDINGVAIARFKSGALASISIGGNCPPFRTDILLQTDKLLIQTDQYGAKLEMWGPSGKRVYPHVEQEFNPSGAVGTPHQNFVNALNGKEPLRAPVRYGVLLSVLMDAMYQSADEKKLVSVEPVPDEI